jgi:membrane protease YdiL (CAAX protease family)
MNETTISLTPDRAEKKLIRSYYNKGAAAAVIFVILYFMLQIFKGLFDLSVIDPVFAQAVNMLLVIALEVAAISGGCYFTGQNWKDFFKNREGYNIGTILKTYVTTQGLGYLGMCLAMIVVVIIAVFGGDAQMPTQTQNLTPGQSAIVAIHAIIVAPILEEFICRGVILNGIKKYNQTLALVVSSITFGLIHGNAFQFFFATVMGFVLGTIALKCKSIIPTIFAHAGVNMTAMALQLVSKLTGMDDFGIDISKVDWTNPESIIALQQSIPPSLIIISNLIMIFVMGIVAAAIIIAALHIKKFRTYCPRASKLGKTRGFPVFITSPAWIILFVILFAEAFVMPFVLG